MKVVWSASLAVGIHGLFVEALNKKAHTFYQSLGFIPLVGENENALFSQPNPSNCFSHRAINASPSRPVAP